MFMIAELQTPTEFKTLSELKLESKFESKIELKN